MKYYGIGLSRTGTSSLCKAFKMMGFKSKHHMEGREWAKVDTYDFVDDHPIASRFEELDERFAGSKFIYTIREKQSWMRSIENHMGKKKNISRKMKYCRIELYGTPIFNEDKMSLVYDKHDTHVREYFKNRPNDLLIMNICEGDGWDKLVPFIGLDNIPNLLDFENILFPLNNEAKYKE